ncbi:Mif2/CENP-C like-domain-containing protein [Lipomyces orientalis]|uniref:Mif2/CENP-C like-domain-containing protein n=1 Tax=Lipomyces orientalis TaxID=1233043 RepID=A0ACC3TG85_9ASCO
MPLLSIDQVLSRLDGDAERANVLTSATRQITTTPIEKHASLLSSLESSMRTQLNTPPRSSPSPETSATPSVMSSPPSPPLTNPERPCIVEDAVIDADCRSMPSSLKRQRRPFSFGCFDVENYELHADSGDEETSQDVRVAQDSRHGDLSLLVSSSAPILSSRQNKPIEAADEESDHVLSGSEDVDDVFAKFVEDVDSAEDYAMRSSSPLSSRRTKISKTATAGQTAAMPLSPVKNESNAVNCEDEPVRRSSRTRMKPLEYWKNERIVYNLVRDEEQGHAVPAIKSIVRASSGITEELPKTSKRKFSLTSLESYTTSRNCRTRRAVEGDVKGEFDIVNDSDAEEIVTEVEEYSTGERITRRVAIPSTALPYIAVSNSSSNFEFVKTFEEDGGFLATGVLRLPANTGSKGCRKTRANALVFCVLEGTVKVVLNQQVAFRIRRSGHFLVPRGNSYSLECVGKKMAVLFYAQGTDSLYNAIENNPETLEKI